MAAVRKALGPSKPLVLVLMGGGVIDTSAVDDLVDAVLWVGYPGQSGGLAVAEVLCKSTSNATIPGLASGGLNPHSDS